MNLPESYIEDLLVRSTYHSVALNEDVISIQDTIAILIKKHLPPLLSKDLYNQIENHRHALFFIFRKALNNETLSFPILFEIHYLLMDKLTDNRGQFKVLENKMKMKGNKFITASPKETPILMNQWLHDINGQVANNIKTDDWMTVIAMSHITFLHIHPFQTGNELVGRLINLYLQLQQGLAPIIVENHEKARYEHLIINQQIKELASFFKEKMTAEEHRLQHFRQKES